jgi:hypothetical protein
MSDEIRPRGGWVEREDGSRTEVRYIPTSEPNAFLAVSIDGDPIELDLTERITADALGPGQCIKVTVRAPSSWAEVFRRWQRRRP